MNLTIILICITLMVNNVKLLFILMVNDVILIFHQHIFFGEISVQVFYPFLNRLFVLNLESSLYNLDSSPLLDMRFAISPHFIASFYPLNRAIHRANVYNFDEV